MKQTSTLRLYGEAPGSIVDGPGIRYAIFCQGCTHHCLGCHNGASQPHEGGRRVEVDTIVEHVVDAESCSGATLSGGEPFEQPEACALLAKKLQEQGIGIWLYTGFLFEDLVAMSRGEQVDSETKYCNHFQAEAISSLLHNVDVIVDGPFVKEKKSYDALYRGSTNQRLIDVPATLENEKIIL